MIQKFLLNDFPSLLKTAILPTIQSHLYQILRMRFLTTRDIIINT